MKITKKLLSMVIASIMVLSLASCASKKATPTGKEKPAVKKETSNVVTDAMGRKVTLPKNPKKVVALTGASMEAMRILGVPVVGKVEEYKIKSELSDLPSIGRAESINIEAIYDLKPDLIIAQTRKHTAIKDALMQSGAAVYYFDPDLFGEIPLIDIVPYFGEILGKSKAGNEYKKEIEKFAAGYQKQIKEKIGDVKGIVINHGDTIKAAINASAFGTTINLLGVKNIVPDDLPGSDKGSFVSYDMEAITRENPDIIFIMMATKDKKARANIIKSYKSNPLWAELDATKKGKLIGLPFCVNPNKSTAKKMIKTAAETILATAK